MRGDNCSCIIFYSNWGFASAPNALFVFATKQFSVASESNKWKQQSTFYTAHTETKQPNFTFPVNFGHIKKSLPSFFFKAAGGVDLKAHELAALSGSSRACWLVVVGKPVERVD